MPITRVIDVQATEGRFRTMLVDAFPDRAMTVEGRVIHIGGEGTSVRVRLHDRPDLHPGSLDLPMERVEFVFDDASEAEADAFMESYREATMRTGG